MPKSSSKARKGGRKAAAKPQYKLTSFDGRFHAEPARMLFKLKAVPFDDARVEYHGEEWQKLKSDKTRIPLGMLPVLEKSDGRVLPQCRAIYRYLAREFGYYGNNNEEDSEIDALCETVADIERALMPAFEEQDDEKRAALVTKMRDSNLKPFFDFFVDCLESSDGTYFVGDRLTMADLVIYNILDFFMEGKFAVKGFFETFPTLLTFYAGIKTDSALAEYLKDRPVTLY